MKIQVDQSRFCTLSGNKDWQDWLKREDPELYADLMRTRMSGRGCNANKEKMKQIYSLLYSKGKGEAFEKLIQQRFQYLILNIKDIDPKVLAEAQRKPTEQNNVKMPPRILAATNAENLNKHKIFASYKPGILSFPKKMIFVNSDKNQLEAIVKHFLKDKTSFDYIIVDDRAYVEYFNLENQQEADKIPKESREIYKYRMAHGG